MTDFKDLLRFHVKRVPNCSTPEQFKEWRSFAQQQIPSYTSWFCTDCTPEFQLKHKKQGTCDHSYIKFKKIEGSLDGFVPAEWADHHKTIIKRLSKEYKETKQEAKANLNGSKYCAYCYSYQSLSEGKWIRTNNKNGHRWKCKKCNDLDRNRPAVPSPNKFKR
jgi:hypothetical protein